MVLKRKFTLILFGDPASGKDTQSKLLCKKFKLTEFSSGQALRKLKERDGNASQVLAKDMDKGKMASTKIYRKLLLDSLPKITKSKNLLLNGTPRMFGEARLMLKFLQKLGRPRPVVVYLNIPESEIIKRTRLRASVGGRADDMAVHTRIREHRLHLARVFDYFKTRVPIAKVSGTGTTEEVNKRLAQAIEKLVLKV